MSRRTRLPGPIENMHTGDSKEVPVGESRWISVDVTDPEEGWTLNNVANSIVNASASTGGLRVEIDKDDNGLRWNNTNQAVGRYYKKLRGPYGPLTWADKFSIEILIELGTVHGNTGTADRGGVNLGIADASCTADTSDVEWIGLGAFRRYTSPEGLVGNIGGDTGMSGHNEPSSRKIYAYISPPIDETDNDTDPTTRRALMILMDENNVYLDCETASEQTHEYVSTDDVYMFLAPSFSGTTNITENHDTEWKIWYRINLAPDGFSPSYIPGSGVSG